MGSATDASVGRDNVRQRRPDRQPAERDAGAASQTVRELNSGPKVKKTYGRTPDGMGKEV